MLDLAIVDKLNRAGFVVAPYSTPEEVPSTCRGTRDLIVRLKLFKRRQSTVRRETTGHKQNQNQARTHRYQVQRCAGPVEVQRARK